MIDVPWTSDKEFLHGDYIWRFPRHGEADVRRIATGLARLRRGIVSESFRPGVTVNEVAERYGMKANHLSSWRTLARQGKLLLPQPEDAVEFAAMIVEPPASIDTLERPSTKSGCRAEIVIGSVTIRLKEGASAARIAAIARALAAST